MHSSFSVTGRIQRFSTNAIRRLSEAVGSIGMLSFHCTTNSTNVERHLLG